MAQHTLLPSLTALVPASTHARFLAHVSLQSIHVEPYHLTEHVYTATSQVVPGQLKSLRIRQKRRNTGKSAPGLAREKSEDHAEGYEGNEGEDGHDGYEYSVVHLSNPLSGREYADMSVRACTALEVVGCETRGEVEAFVRALGFQYSHSYTRSGLLFHLPLPYPASHMTLHLTVTRIPIHTAPSLRSESDKPDQVTQDTEPYLVQLEPCRPIPAVVSSITTGSAGASADTNAKRDPGLEEMARLVQEASGRIQGVVWETGR